MDIAVACSARRQGEGCDEGDGRVAFGPEKVELDLQYVKAKVNQDDFVLVNRAANYLPAEAAKQLKFELYSADGDHRSVLVFLGPLASCVRSVLGPFFWPCVCVLEFAFSLTF